MHGLTETRNEIHRAAGFNAGLMWRKSVANLVLSIGCIGLAGWSSYVSYKAHENVRTVALIFDQNLSLLAKADASKPFVPTDDFYVREATSFIQDFRRRPTTRKDYERQLNANILPVVATEKLKDNLTKVAEHQTKMMGATDVDVTRLSVLPDGERPDPYTARLRASWTERANITGRTREWEAILIFRYVPRTNPAEFGLPGYGMKLVGYQSTQIGE